MFLDAGRFNELRKVELVRGFQISAMSVNIIRLDPVTRAPLGDLLVEFAPQLGAIRCDYRLYEQTGKAFTTKVIPFEAEKSGHASLGDLDELSRELLTPLFSI